MSEVRNIDAEISEHKEKISLRDALLRLEKNRDFRKVIEKAYGEEFAKNLIMQRALPEMRSRPEMIEANTRKVDAISELFHFLRGVHAMGAHAEQALPEAELTREEILDEDEE